MKTEKSLAPRNTDVLLRLPNKDLGFRFALSSAVIDSSSPSSNLFKKQPANQEDHFFVSM